MRLIRTDDKDEKALKRVAKDKDFINYLKKVIDAAADIRTIESTDKAKAIETRTEAISIVGDNILEPLLILSGEVPKSNPNDFE